MPYPRLNPRPLAGRLAALTGAAVAALLLTALLLSATGEDTSTAVAAPGDFRLPYAAGQRLFLLQGQNQGSHTGPYSRFAYDFATGPFDNTPFVVTAARAGKVVRVVQSNPSSKDCDLATYSQSNNVLLDHGDNVGSSYSHLLQGSVTVKVGDQVTQGQPIAQSNHSGYVCGVSHLHFSVVNIKTMVGLDIPFADSSVMGVGGRPQTDNWYVAGVSPKVSVTGAGAPVYRLNIPLMQRQRRK